MTTPTIYPPLIRAARREFLPGVNLLICRLEGGALMTVAELEFQELPAGHAPKPTMELSLDDAQALIDQLWDCGLRPSEGSGSAGALAATQKHLDDFRRLVFDDARTKP